VDDPEAFSEMLMHGVGRHCSFGYGMLLLKPAP
jgi:CRISPR system Cascade subunit CasE